MPPLSLLQRHKHYKPLNTTNSLPSVFLYLESMCAFFRNNTNDKKITKTLFLDI